MAEFKVFWDDDMLAVVEGVGYPDQSYSHFKSMHVWQTEDQDGKLGSDPGQKAIRTPAHNQRLTLGLNPARVFRFQAHPDAAILLGNCVPGDPKVMGSGMGITVEALQGTGIKYSVAAAGFK